MEKNQPHDRHVEAGSPLGEPAYIAVGKIRRPHGVKGEMLMEVLTDFPERLTRGKIVYVGATYQLHTIQSTRNHAAGMLVRMEGYEDPEKAGELRNAMVYVKTSELPVLPDGEFYLHQIIGFKVVDERKILLGFLVEILETGANDVYLVKSEHNDDELLLPAIESVILDVNFDTREMVVRLPEWF
ncbi:MAG: 16S rRNA processing protein RimM [Anaerolineae bacterium]|nr:16S rRNA processing protein RimM [Anaerolineae bacterium]